MDKNTARRFRDKVFKRALLDANRLLSPKEERAKMLIRITSGMLFLALLLGLASAQILGAREAFNNILITLVIDGAFFLLYQGFPRLWAGFHKWQYAAQLHDEMGGFDLPNIKVDVNSKTYEISLVTLQITNNSKYPIKDCFIKIVDIEPQMITYVADDVILEWTDHFVGQSKIELGINDGQQRHIANAVVASWIGGNEERKVLIFTTSEPYKEHKYIGVPQRYKITLEFNGNYLWQEYKQKEVVEIEPNLKKALADSSIDIRKIRE